MLTDRYGLSLSTASAGARDAYIHWGQEMYDQGGMLREVVKWEYELRNAEQVETVVDRALALVPEERTSSIEEFAASIAQFGTSAAGASLTHIQLVAAGARRASLEQIVGQEADVPGDGRGRDARGGGLLRRREARCGGGVGGCRRWRG